MDVLRRDLKLEIEDIDKHPKVRETLVNYYELLGNYLATVGANRGTSHV